MMSELEEKIKKIKGLIDSAVNLVAKIDMLYPEIETLVEAESKPKYPDGTPGTFGNKNIFGFLATNRYTGEYCRHLTPEINNYQGSFKNFTPLPEAILPHPVENTGTCPWNDGDEVRVEFEDGEFATDDTPEKWNWKSNRGNNIVRSQLIKRAGE